MGENDSTDTAPRGVTDEEWQALGDPGKNALRRERQVRADLERQLAEARRPPASQPPAQHLTPTGSAVPAPPAAPLADTPVFAGLIKDAIEAALGPIRQRFDRDDAAKAQDDKAKAQQAFTATLGERAGQVLADVRDAALLDTTSLADANGVPDSAKIDAALTQLVTDRPHLAKMPARQQFGAPSAQGAGFGPPGTSLTPQQAADDLRTRYGA